MKYNELIIDKILDLAIRGELIANDVSLEPVNINNISYSPYSIPNNWKWVKMEQIVDYQNGYAYNSGDMSKNGNGVPVIKSANIGSKKVVIDAKTDYVENPTERMLKSSIHKGDILMVLSSQSSNVQPLGVSALYEKEEIALLNQRVLKIIPDNNYVVNKYLLYCINSKWFHEKLSNKAAGLAQANLKLEHVLQMEVPLPPIIEQNKIASCIDRLLSLVEEKMKNDELKDTYKKLLKEKILDQAIHGSLCNNISTEENATKLKEKFKNTKEELEKNKTILKKPKLDDKDILIPFEIPTGWFWSYLSNVSIIQEGAGIRKHQYTDDGIQLFSVTNILDGAIDLNKKKLYVSEEEWKEKYKHLTLNYGDIVTACSGGSWGKVAIYDQEDTVMLNTSTLRLRFFNDLCNNSYLYYVAQSKYFKNKLADQLVGIQPNLGYKHYSTIPIPIPNVEEQDYIVEKIEKLFSIIDEL